MKTVGFVALLALIPACVQPKSTSTNYKKAANAGAEDASPLGETDEPQAPEAPPTTFLSSWERCTPMPGAPTVKALKETIFLVDASEMKYQAKMYTDVTCKKDMTTAELAKMYKESNPDQKATKAITAAFNEAMLNGEIMTGVYAAAASGTEGTIDFADMSGQQAYRHYKIVGTALQIAKACLESDTANGAMCKISGDSEENRAKDFSSVDSFTKVSATSSTTDTMGGSGTQMGGSGTAAMGTNLAPSTWTSCIPVAAGRSVYQEFVFMDGTRYSSLNRMHPDSACATKFTDAQLLAYYKESTPGQNAATTVPANYRVAVSDGVNVYGTYIATSATAGTIDTPDTVSGKSEYSSFKIDGMNLSVALTCAKEEIGQIPECKMITGDSATNRAADYGFALNYKKK